MHMDSHLSADLRWRKDAVQGFRACTSSMSLRNEVDAVNVSLGDRAIGVGPKPCGNGNVIQ